MAICALAVEDEPAEVVGLHAQRLEAGPLDRHRRLARRQQLTGQAPLARAGLGHLDLDPELRRLEGQLTWAAAAAHQQASLLVGGGVGAVAQQLGDLGVNRPPAERGPGGVIEQLRDGVEVGEDRPQLGFGRGVFVSHWDSPRSVAVTPSPSASPRRRSRHR